MVLRVPKLLKNFNSGNRHPHWRVKHRERQSWATAIHWAAVVAGHAGYSPRKLRMRLTLEREVPSKRNFIKDRDNLLACTKEARDALKALGLIYDDSIAWLEMPDPIQRVSADGRPWTVITIEPLEGVTDGKAVY